MSIKNQKRREVIRKLSEEKGVSLKVAAHIYACWPRKKQQKERAQARCDELNSRDPDWDV